MKRQIEFDGAMMTNNAAVFEINAELLASILDLPEGTRIAGMQQGSHGLRLLVEHPDLPPVEDGQEIPEIQPQYMRDDTGAHFISWKP